MIDEEIRATTAALEDALPDSLNDQSQNPENNDLNTPPSSPEPISHDNEVFLDPIESFIPKEYSEKISSEIYDEFCKWLTNPTENRPVYSNNANSKFWIQIIQNLARQNQKCILIPSLRRKSMD